MTVLSNLIDHMTSVSPPTEWDGIGGGGRLKEVMRVKCSVVSGIY